MSVAETSAPSLAAVRAPYQQLAMHSLIGGAFLLFSIWFVLAGLPLLWSDGLGIETFLNNEFLASALLMVVSLVAIVGFFFLFQNLERQFQQPGLRAGVAIGAFAMFIALWLTMVFGNWLQTRPLGLVGPVLTLAVLGGLGFLIFKLFFRPAWALRLQGYEENGWFHATSYKGNQGLRVRRGTLLAILIIGALGIITLVRTKALGTDRLEANNWEWTIPYTSGGESAGMEQADPGRVLPLIFKVNVVVPVIMAIALFWFAWRVVNWPTFADFLIATEAEINKVSWTSRKRLVQDTIVVLVTVILMTTFLFVVDILWIKGLSLPWIHVLQVDIKAEAKKNEQTAGW